MARSVSSSLSVPTNNRVSPDRDALPVTAAPAAAAIWLPVALVELVAVALQAASITASAANRVKVIILRIFDTSVETRDPASHPYRRGDRASTDVVTAPLLVPQGLNRVELRGPRRGIEAEEDAHREGRAEGQQDGRRHDDGAHPAQQAEQPRAAHARRHADQPAGEAQPQRLGEELPADVGGRRAHRLADADFARALGDA